MTGRGPEQNDVERTAIRFRRFAEGEVTGLPVYTRIVEAAAEDAELMVMMQHAPLGQRRPNLLLAAVHDLLLGGAEHPLAAWYPTVSGRLPPGGDVFPVFRSFIDVHRDEILDALRTRSTQTNEPNRSALWSVAVRAAAADRPDVPLALVELGCSAGLNLLFDRYGYDWGATGSPDDRLRCVVRGDDSPLRRPLPPIATRIGIDREPVALDDPRGLRWLKACLWPEQMDRHRRFDAAVVVARHHPPTIIAGDLVDELPDVIDGLDPRLHVVVVNSWVLTYLPRDRRAAIDPILGVVGAERPVTWISAEGPGVVDWVGRPADGELSTVVGMAMWRDGRRRDTTVATCHAHLEWLDWRRTLRS